MIKNHVEQLDDYGCPIACVAMVCNKSYYAAKKYIRPNRDMYTPVDSHNPISTREMLCGLRAFKKNISVKQVNVTKASKIQGTLAQVHQDAILTLDRVPQDWMNREELDTQHCLAYCATTNRLYDPCDENYDPVYNSFHYYFNKQFYKLVHIIWVN